MTKTKRNRRLAALLITLAMVFNSISLTFAFESGGEHSKVVETITEDLQINFSPSLGRSITALDVFRLRQYLAGHDVTIEHAAADVNQDGVVDMDDVVLLEMYLAGHPIGNFVPRILFKPTPFDAFTAPFGTMYMELRVSEPVVLYGGSVQVEIYIPASGNPGSSVWDLFLAFDESRLEFQSAVHGFSEVGFVSPPVDAPSPLRLSTTNLGLASRYDVGTFLTVNFNVRSGAPYGTANFTLTGDVHGMALVPPFEPHPIPVTFTNAYVTILSPTERHLTNVESNGISRTADTTQLVLTFNDAVTETIAPSNIVITNQTDADRIITSGSVTGIGNSRTVQISGTWNNGDLITIAITGVAGYAIITTATATEIFRRPTISVVDPKEPVAVIGGRPASFTVILENMSHFETFYIEHATRNCPVFIDIIGLRPGITASGRISYENGRGIGTLYLTVNHPSGRRYFAEIVSQLSEIFVLNDDCDAAAEIPANEPVEVLAHLPSNTDTPNAHQRPPYEAVIPPVIQLIKKPKLRT